MLVKHSCEIQRLFCLSKNRTFSEGGSDTLFLKVDGCTSFPLTRRIYYVNKGHRPTIQSIQFTLNFVIVTIQYLIHVLTIYLLYSESLILKISLST